MIDFKTAERVVLERLAADERLLNSAFYLPGLKERPYRHLVVRSVTEHEFGWVFHYGTTEPLEPVDFGRFFPFGNAPFIVEKSDGRLHVMASGGRLHVMASGLPVECHIEAYRRWTRHPRPAPQIDPEFVLQGIATSLMAVVPMLRVAVAWEPPNTASVIASFAGSNWDGYSSLGHVDDDGNPLEEERTADDWRQFAIDALSRIKDIVTEATTTPWPLVMVSGRRETVGIDVRVIDGKALEMTIGAGPGPLIRFAPVPLYRAGVMRPSTPGDPQ